MAKIKSKKDIYYIIKSINYTKPGQREYNYCRNKNGVLMEEHRVVWEEHNKRKIPADGIIHHINLNKKDNRIENLALTDIKNHKKFHKKSSY